MNDHRAVVVGICLAKESFGEAAYVFTTYARATQFVPGQRKMVTHILAVPVEGRSANEVTAEIARKRYEKGLANYLEVTDAERTLLQIERSQIQLTGARYASTVKLIKAIRGGWFDNSHAKLPDLK